MTEKLTKGCFDPVPLLERTLDAFRILKEPKKHPSKMIDVRILRNYSAEYVEPFLRAYGHRSGLDIRVRFGSYDASRQDLDEESGSDGAAVFLLSLMLDPLAPDWRDGSIDVDYVVGRVIDLLDLAQKKTSAPVLFNSFLPPLLGRSPASLAVQDNAPEAGVAAINLALRQYARERPSRVVLLDFEALVMSMGSAAALDSRLGYVAAAPYSQRFLGAYAFEIFKILRALNGGMKKCLILDCDGVLWGGVIGEDGINGILLDRNEFPGRVYYDFQKTVVHLAEQGIMVALCSKNNPAEVHAVLDSHPHCPIQRDLLVAERINWEAKEKNIAAIVEELNIGLDSVVFVDDSSMECERVAGFLPDVTVRKVPKPVYELPALLLREGLFDTLAATREDRQRSRLYHDETRRRQARATFESQEAFLASLGLVLSVGEAKPEQFARVAQLTQKTNQFNLTGRRYSISEIADLCGNPHRAAVFCMTSADCFGDNGLSGVLVVLRQEDFAVVDTCLMSCRVLGRQLEQQFVVSAFETLRRRWSPIYWKASFRPTLKNGMVSGFWDRFGFDVTDRTDDIVHYVAMDQALRLEPVTFIAVEN